MYINIHAWGDVPALPLTCPKPQTRSASTDLLVVFAQHLFNAPPRPTPSCAEIRTKMI